MADAELMSLIRRLTFVTSRPSALGTSVSDGLEVEAGARATPSQRAARLRATSAAAPAAARGDGLTGMMAVNLIRAHRDELRCQASSGALDHMVIGVVGSLFDQILSDRASRRRWRQIAWLQLPVLRVALADTYFFSSRKRTRSGAS